MGHGPGRYRGIPPSAAAPLTTASSRRLVSLFSAGLLPPAGTAGPGRGSSRRLVLWKSRALPGQHGRLGAGYLKGTGKCGRSWDRIKIVECTKGAADRCWRRMGEYGRGKSGRRKRIWEIKREIAGEEWLADWDDKC